MEEFGVVKLVNFKFISQKNQMNLTDRSLWIKYIFCMKGTILEWYKSPDWKWPPDTLHGNQGLSLG